MPGYLNRFVDLDLSAYGDGCFIRIHNPKVVPQSMLEPSKKIEVVDGKAVDQEAANEASREVLCGLIKDWKVYDATCLDEEQPLLTLPATPELLRKLPLAVTLELTRLVTDAVPNPS